MTGEPCTCSHPASAHAQGTGRCLACLRCLDPDDHEPHVPDRCECPEFTPQRPWDGSGPYIAVMAEDATPIYPRWEISGPGTFQLTNTENP